MDSVIAKVTEYSYKVAGKLQYPIDIASISHFTYDTI